MHIDLTETWQFFLLSSCLPYSPINPPQPYRCRLCLPNKALRLLKGLSTYRTHRRADGWGRPEPRATPFPGMGAHLLRAVQVPGQGKHEWDHSWRPECFLSTTTTHLALSAWGGLTILFFLRAHQEVLGQHKRGSARRNHLTSKPATHLTLKFKECAKHMVSFA